MHRLPLYFLLLASAIPTSLVRSEENAIALLADPSFENGVWVLDPTPGRKKITGTLQPRETEGEPAWSLAQWYSRDSLAGAGPRYLKSGAVVFSDSVKSITFGHRELSVFDLELALDGALEYGGEALEKGDPWPHLLLQQRAREHPPLGDLENLHLHLEYQLKKCEQVKTAQWNPKRHTAQFLAFLTVQNLNRQSEGFGDYLWFGIPMFDARYEIPVPHMARDRGSDKKQSTGKFIYTPGGEAYKNRDARDHQWITIDAQLLPMIHQALQTAWERGYLTDSKNLDDYRIGGINFGWEVTGMLNVAGRIRNLSLTATPKDP